MSAVVKLGPNRLVGGDNSTFIIAEIGQNHQGDINIAKQLIKVAKDCGADCAKFQKTCLSEKFNKRALERPYNGPNAWGPTYGQHKQFLEFTPEQFVELQAYANEIDILFTASAMDETSLEYLASINVPFIKIGSGDVNNCLLIEKAAQLGIPLVISTGMQNLEGVYKIYEIVSKHHKNFALLHCISSYPTPLDDINLRVMNLYKEKFADVPIGYSGHELGIHITLGAVATGAKIVERHITLDKRWKGSDHNCSLEPEEFKLLIEQIRDLERALGQPVKKFQASEQSCYDKLGKTIVAAKSLVKGHILQLDDVKIKVAEPKGIDGGMLSEVIGKVVKIDVPEDESILEEYIG